MEWSGAVAPMAEVDFAGLRRHADSWIPGTIVIVLRVVDNNTDDIMSLSFGTCEASLGAENAFFNRLWEQAAAQGITVTVSAGDPGSAGCDDFNTATMASTGLAVSVIASTPFNVAVGGTDFHDIGTQSTFCKQNPAPPAPQTANDPVTRLSVKGYVPETTWNDSCAAMVQRTVHRALTTCVGAVAGSA